MVPVQQVGQVVQNLSLKEQEDFGPNNWKKRRLVIFWTLAICAAAFVSIAGSTVTMMLISAYVGKPLTFDQNLIALASTIVWASVSTATTIILGYVFGANLDAKDYRKQMSELSATGPQYREQRNPPPMPYSAQPYHAEPQPEYGTPYPPSHDQGPKG